MAPEFFPLIAFLGLAFIALVGFCLGVVRTITTRRVPRLLGAVVVGAVLLLLVLGKMIHQQFFLNEPFAIACGQGDMAEAQCLLSRGASPDAYGIDFNETAMITACRHGHLDIAKFLLLNGARLDLKDSRGRTALQRAREAGHMNIVCLIEQAEESQRRKGRAESNR